MPEQFYNVATYLARDSVGYLVRRLYSILSARIEASFAGHDLTLMQWGVLMHLRDGLARTASDIANDFQHDSGALTRVIDKLERRALLQRRRSSRDRRVVELELTPAGHKIIATLLPTVVAEMNAALEPLDRTEFEQFRSVLVRVLDHLQEGRPALAAPPRAARATPKAPARATKRTAARKKAGKRP
jgi:DNA-binding MarR family transcriptional regulator